MFTAQWFRCGGRVAHYLIGRYVPLLNFCCQCALPCVICVDFFY
ncbi:hypothetical protein DNG97_24480 [Vibrio parahaemolyticus]|nr:hypothetical protein [Vibrio parahaemolyticus]